MTNLEAVKSSLQADEFDCSIIGENENAQLALFLGQDHRDRERILSIQPIEQVMPPEQCPDFTLIELRYTFPFSLTDHATADTARLVAMFNHGAEVPGFECDEIDGKIHYRHVLFSDGKDLNFTTIKSLIGVILVMLDLYSAALEEVATGKTTFIEIMGSLVKTANLNQS